MTDNRSIHHEIIIGEFETTQSTASTSDNEHKVASTDESIDSDPIRPTNWFRRFLYDYNAEVGEFFAMFIFVFIGCNVTAQIIFRLPHSEGSKGITISLGWGLGLIGSVLIAGGTSGGYLNPAVTIAKAVFGQYPWKRVPGMVFAQTFGSFVGALFTWLYYYPMFDAFDGGKRQSVGERPTANIFVIQPTSSGIYTNANLFFNEAFMTFCMLFCVHFIGDKRMSLAYSHAPIVLGLLLAAILLAGAQISAIGINPGRDLGPRIFAVMAGYHDIFSFYNYYFYVPLISPIVGGIAAQGLYDYIMVPTSIKPKSQQHHYHISHRIQPGK